jgi:hypothetical protein
MADEKGTDSEATSTETAASLIPEAVAPAPDEADFAPVVEVASVEEAEPEEVETQSHSSYLPGFVPLEGSAISDHPGAQFEYNKSLRDMDKQAAANDGGRSFDAEGTEAEDRLQEKLDFLSEEEVFARTFPGSGGHGDLPGVTDGAH